MNTPPKISDFLSLWPVEGHDSNGSPMSCDFYQDKRLRIQSIVGKKVETDRSREIVQNFFREYPHFDGYVGEVF